MKKIIKLLNPNLNNCFDQNFTLKSFSRSKTSSQACSLFEENSNFFPISLKKKFGSSSNIQLFSFTDKFSFLFKLYRSSFTVEYKNLLNSLNRVLFCLNKINDSKSTYRAELFLLKPIRSGFRAFYSGLKGFIFLNDIKQPLYTFLKSFRLYNYKEQLLFLNRLEASFFFIKLRFNNIEIIFRSQYHKRKFRKKKIKNISPAYLNIVFKAEKPFKNKIVLS